MGAVRSRRRLRRVLVLAEAASSLTLAALALRLLPFRWLSSVAVRPDGRAGEPAADPGGSDPRAAGIGTAIAGAAARLPWTSTCLARALAGRMMLARRGVPSVLYLGVAKDADALRAHAWLLAGGTVVCGGREAAGYTAIAECPSGPAPRARTS